jgi:hypothetical protein
MSRVARSSRSGSVPIASGSPRERNAVRDRGKRKVMLVLLVEHIFTPEGRERFLFGCMRSGRPPARFPGFVDIRQMTT